MKTVKELSLFKLPCQSEACLTCGTYDSYYFYFVSSNHNHVLKVDYKNRKYLYFPVTRAYTLISYDFKNNLFLTIEDKNLFILDKNFKEINEISLESIFGNNNEITSISPYYKNDLILINSNYKSLILDKEGNIYKSSIYYNYISVLNMNDLTFALYKNSSDYYIDVYRCNEPIDSYRLPYSINCPIDILASNYCRNDNLIILALLTKDSNSNYYINHILINISYIAKDLFYTKDSKKADAICCLDDLIKKKNNYCSNNNVHNDIIESIALIETTLSYILNAECEKIQKGIRLAKNVNELVSVNKSVERTLKYAIGLENILYKKLLHSINSKD